MRLAICATLAALPLAAQVIIDTDSGLFGDDGAAITMMLRRAERLRPLGVTVVSGNVWAPQGARYMRDILRAAGAPKTPLLVGAHHPLVHTATMAEIERREFARSDYRGAFDQRYEALDSASAPRAVDFIIDSVRAHPGQVRLVALGPMTNIAMALRLAPDIETKIHSIVWMGGNLRADGVPKAEFNFWFDPEAAQAVLRSNIPEKTMFGLDVCEKVRVDKALFDAIAAHRTPVTALFREDFGNHYPGFYKNPRATVPLWDALVAAWLIEPATLKRAENLRLDVDARFGKTYGAVVPLEVKLAPKATPVRHVIDVDPARVIALYRELLSLP